MNREPQPDLERRPKRCPPHSEAAPALPVLSVLLLALMLPILAACTGVLPTPFPTQIVPTLAPKPTLNPAGDAQHGAELFVTWRCGDCHGAQGEGRVGPSLARTILDFDSFVTAVRQTRPPKPSFNETELPKESVRDIYVWLQSREPMLTGSTPGQPPALAVGEILGMTLYTAQKCDSCHGAFAQGGEQGPALSFYPKSVEEFLNAMLKTAEKYPEHQAAALEEALMRRLYRWLVEGADPLSGC